MSVKIRMRKTGANNDPCFRIVATDSRKPRDGAYLESLGWYDPKKKESNFFLQLDRIEVWKNQGAQISDTVKSLLRKAKKGKMASPAPAAVAAK
ncbi:MAG: 30S ribosomal protein S16 [Lentisphaerae bacterium]|nr:30S ribosomal protein S16 [Lentisphaerota bacterium]